MRSPHQQLHRAEGKNPTGWESSGAGRLQAYFQDRQHLSRVIHDPQKRGKRQVAAEEENHSREENAWEKDGRPRALQGVQPECGACHMQEGDR